MPIIKALILTLGLICISFAKAGSIALSFDDAPMRKSAFMDGPEITQKIIQGLKDNGVDSAMFFVTSNAIDQEGKQRLLEYANAGFTLANHSHSHPSAHKVSVIDYLMDVYQSHLILKNFGYSRYEISNY